MAKQHAHVINLGNGATIVYADGKLIPTQDTPENLGQRMAERLLELESVCREGIQAELKSIRLLTELALANRELKAQVEQLRSALAAVDAMALRN